MKIKLLAPTLVALFVICHPAAQADPFAFTQLCWATPPTTSDNDFINPDAFVDCGEDPAQQTIHQVTANPNGGPDQVFDGSVSATATADLWRVSANITLSNYQRDMYQTSTTTSSTGVYPTPAAAEAGFSDTLDVTAAGGPGVYSLSYIYSIDGSLTSTDDSLFTGEFCATLSLPEGTGTQTSRCFVDDSNSIPSTFTLSYADLPFGGPIDPTLNIAAFALITPISPDDVGTDIDTVISGEATAAFGSTIHLTDVLVTDANGNPIPGVTITSSNGVEYPLDPANLATPEPGGLSIVAMALLAGAGLWKRRLARRLLSRQSRDQFLLDEVQNCRG